MQFQEHVTEKDHRRAQYKRKHSTKTPERPKSRYIETQEAFVIDSTNRTCHSCKQVVHAKTARRRFREMFRVAESKGAKVILSKKLERFNAKCKCGAFLQCK